MTRQYARHMWGWPYRFIGKARENGSKVYLMVDSAEDLEWAEGLPVDGVVTDYIELVGSIAGR